MLACAGRPLATHAASAPAPARKQKGKKKPGKGRTTDSTAAQQAQSRRSGNRAAQETQKRALDALSRGASVVSDDGASTSAAAESESDDESANVLAARQRRPAPWPATQSEEGSGAEPPDVVVVKRSRAPAMEAQTQARTRLPGEVYEHPKFYDWAVAYRDYEMEVRFAPIRAALCLRAPCCPRRRAPSPDSHAQGGRGVASGGTRGPPCSGVFAPRA